LNPSEVLIARSCVDGSCDLPFVSGNIHTRLQKLEQAGMLPILFASDVLLKCFRRPPGDYDAIILAAVGLRRVDLGDKITEVIHRPIQSVATYLGLISKVLDGKSFPYSVSQGALGIECRGDDVEVREMLKTVEHTTSFLCCTAERAILNGLQGGCQVPSHFKFLRVFVYVALICVTS